ncbi:MAG TPA: AmmeMemoRadiSam system protein A [Anaeromyxobacter sp.]
MTTPALTATDRAALLGIARGAILAHLGVAPAPPLPAAGALSEPRGAFVTLHVRGELRGCIGTFRPQGSLASTVARMAVAAASDDPRFPPLRPGEIAELGVAVSVLGPPRPIADPRTVEIGRQGLLVSRGWNRGTLLPKVAVEHGWGAEEFLKHTCLKAGLPPRAWQEPDVMVEVFDADEFGEEAGA